MAFADDLQSFLETRLLALDPTIDLSPSSPAQTEVIGPTLARFADDPFTTDIPTFVKDRMLQEFPELVSDSGGLLEDILSKPLQLILEPFKREISLTRLGQSARNAALMSDDEADALGANWFESRDEGNTAGGGVRIFFSAPSTVRVTTDKRVYTAAGLAFYPAQNYFLTSAQMLYNRQGSLYFLDIVVRAEQAGSEYNIKKGDIVGIDDLPNAIKTTNLSDFVDGAPRETNVAYLGRFDQALTERSLVTKRGILSRTPKLYESVRALQVVGAGQLGMNRDILTGTGEGFLHLAGTGVIYGNWLWVSTITYKDDGPANIIVPQAGDKVRIHIPVTPGLPTNVLEASVSAILSATGGKYLLMLGTSPYAAGTTYVVNYALFKPGSISISNVPGGISSGFSVPDNTVHLGGHTDVFVRPTADAVIQDSLSNVTDDAPVLALLDLSTTGADNTVFSAAVTAQGGFEALGVLAGDTLVIETGTGVAGTYRVLEVETGTGGALRLDSLFSATVLNLRARVVRNINVDLVSPRVPKLPFNTGSVSDLQTNVGSNELRFLTTNIQDYGAAIGDVVKILDGPDAGEYRILSFSSTLGGNAASVDRIVSATGSGLRYEVYTSLKGLTTPLIRIMSLEVLDSTGQGTGITVPYGDAVDIRPTANFEGAGKDRATLDQRLIIMPDMHLIWDTAPGNVRHLDVVTGTPGASTDARYSQVLEMADGTIRTVTSDASNTIQTTEINVPPFMWNGRRDKVLALTTKADVRFTGPAGDHKTSDLAESRIGDTLTITDGPNQGKYLIQDVRVLDLWGKADAGHRRVALLQVDPPFPVDPLRDALDFMFDNGLTEFIPGGATVGNELFGFLQYAADWDNASGFYETFITKLRTTLNTVFGSTMFATNADLKAFFDPLLRSGYTVGPAAKGDFRLYFLEPTSAEFYFGNEPTEFVSATDSAKMFRVRPDLPPAQIFPESEDGTGPLLWNRNLGLPYNIGLGNFVKLTSGDAVAKRGIRTGDVVEFQRAINDLPARGSMSSSWVAVTQSGSNTVQLLMPKSSTTTLLWYGGVDNFTALLPGQLLFIDSGPDIGAYTIVKVLGTPTWTADQPVIKVQLDRSLSHSTEDVPDLGSSKIDFTCALPAMVSTSGLLAGSFPMNIAGKKIKLLVSTDGGVTSTPTERTFDGGLTSASIDDVVAALNTLYAGIAHWAVYGTEIVGTQLTATGPLSVLEVATPSSDSSYSLLSLTNGVHSGVRGAMALPGTKRIYGDAFNGTVAINDWITLYAAKSATVLAAGDDTAYLGTFQVTAFGTDTSLWSPYGFWVELDRSDNFPAGDYVQVRWVRHAAPVTTPSNTSLGGREISDQFVRVRLYESTPEQQAILDIPWGTPSPLATTSDNQAELVGAIIDPTNHGLVAGQRNWSHMMPYRVLRDGVRRVSSTSMATRREGSLYYVDLPVVGYGPGTEMNVPTSDGFLLEGRYRIEGYVLKVTDENFAFSTQEQVSIVLPSAVLPVGSTPELGNEFSLAGQTVQVTYNNAPLVEDLQRFFDSPLDRVTAADMLVRHFLPAYVFLDISYIGGSVEDDVAKEIISYVNNIDPDVAEIRADFIQDIIKRKNATKVNLPFTIIALVHGTDRRIRGMRSQTLIGSSDLPFFKGTFNQSYFIAGPDTSKVSPRPAGEQVYLKRL